MTTPCPCGSGAAFAACCQPRLTGERPAETAEALMRSRYAAFCTGAVDYLVTTHHPASRATTERADAARSIAATEWVNLLVLDAQGGRAVDTDGTVTFVAAFRPKPPGMGDIGQMHERSRFVREAGAWVYVDGEQLAPYRPGRNDPCWCGSGKKAKRCHG